MPLISSEKTGMTLYYRQVVEAFRLYFSRLGTMPERGRQTDWRNCYTSIALCIF